MSVLRWRRVSGMRWRSLQIDELPVPIHRAGTYSGYPNRDIERASFAGCRRIAGSIGVVVQPAGNAEA